MFDSKIRIYIGFWFRIKCFLKKLLRTFRRQANKSPNISISGIRNPGKNATVLGPPDEFSKILTYYFSSALGLEDNDEKCTLS
jgi:hypothetical protein